MPNKAITLFLSTGLEHCLPCESVCAHQAHSELGSSGRWRQQYAEPCCARDLHWRPLSTALHGTAGSSLFFFSFGTLTRRRFSIALFGAGVVVLWLVVSADSFCAPSGFGTSSLVPTDSRARLLGRTFSIGGGCVNNFLQ